MVKASRLRPILSAVALIAAFAAAGVYWAEEVSAADAVKAPENNEACFAPDEPCSQKLALFIASATVSLDIAIYDINEEQIVHAILVQAKKIPVRVIVDKRQSKGEHSSVALLQKAGVPLKFGHQRGIMHDKFTLVDGKRLETGSFNYTFHASESNQENQLYLATPEVVNRYQARFERMWAAGRPQ